MKNLVKTLAFFGVLLFSFSTQAQTTFGARAGLNLANISIDSDFGGISTDSRMGITIALLADVGVSESFSVQPELHYIQKGYKVETEFLGYMIKGTLTLNYLELPIHAKYKFGKENLGGYVLAGPTIGYALSGNAEQCENGNCQSEKIEFDENDGFKRFELGLSLGGGVTIGENLFIDIRYVLGISNLSNDGSEDTAKNKGIQFGVGYMFGKSESE